MTTRNNYKTLAENLDQLPNRFPATKSGVELDLLAELFSEAEAAVTIHLEPIPKTAKTVAAEQDLDEKQVKTLLKGMVRKGLIEIEKTDGGLGFKLIPFVVGFYENQNGKIDRRFAELFEQYYREAFGKVTDITPALHRVLPVFQTVPVQIDILQYENIETYLEGAKSFGVLDCICRVQKRHIGEGCDHSVHNCLTFNKKENAFAHADAIETVSKEEFLQKLQEAIAEGLVPTASNKQDGLTYICNCCTCSCGIIRAVKEFGTKNSVAKSSYRIQLDETSCTGCGICVDKCQFKALNLQDGQLQVELNACYGCGVCAFSCPTGSLRLVKKSEDQVTPIPRNQGEWDAMRLKK